ncbi:MAG: hypothetical protein MUC87_03120 [Bacteroidia bacterium]|jgi:hypothetical protein|nr:hypothetical protein [Bacteroidia bacterium]
MKLLLVVLIPALLCACTQPEEKTSATPVRPQTLRQWLSTQPKRAHTLVFAMSANDCIPCMRIFSQFFRKQALAGSDTVQLIALFENVRRVERPALLQSVFQGVDTAGVTMVWNTDLFTDALAQVKEGKGVSALLVYDKNLQLTLARYGKTITGLEPELAGFLSKPE